MTFLHLLTAGKRCLDEIDVHRCQTDRPADQSILTYDSLAILCHTEPKKIMKPDRKWSIKRGVEFGFDAAFICNIAWLDFSTTELAMIGSRLFEYSMH